jgi:hypothetical protein
MTTWEDLEDVGYFMSFNGMVVAKIYKPFFKYRVVWTNLKGECHVRKFWSYQNAYAFASGLLK